MFMLCDFCESTFLSRRLDIHLSLEQRGAWLEALTHHAVENMSINLQLALHIYGFCIHPQIQPTVDQTSERDCKCTEPTECTS